MHPRLTLELFRNSKTKSFHFPFALSAALRAAYRRVNEKLRSWFDTFASQTLTTNGLSKRPTLGIGRGLIFITLILISFSNTYCLQEEKHEFESKNVLENLENVDYEERTIYSKDPKTKNNITALCKLSEKKIAIAQHNGKVTIFNIDTGKKEKAISNKGWVEKIIKISKDKFAIINEYFRLNMYTSIKVYNLNNFKKSKELTVTLDHKPIMWVYGIVYLKNNRLVITFNDIAFLVNLDSGITTRFPFLIIYAKQLKDGNFICETYEQSIIILNSDFKLISTVHKNHACDLNVLKNKKSFITRTHTPHVCSLIFSNEKFNFEKIRKNLIDKIPISDLQKIILDYLSDEWQSKVVNTINSLNYFKVISNNYIVNIACFKNTHYDLELWSILSPKLIKTITKIEDHNLDKIAFFKDGTIVVCGEYNVKVLEPIFRV